MYVLDTMPAEVNVEEDAVEKLASEQLREELWDIVAQVLKDEKKIRIFRLRFVENLTLNQIGDVMHVHWAAIDHTIRSGTRMLRSNSRTRNLGEDLGIWSREISIDASRVKRLSKEGNIEYLSKRELKYAANMGWMKPETNFSQRNYPLSNLLV